MAKNAQSKNRKNRKEVVIMSLTEKQRRFCDEYIKDHNATQAAIRAGYSERTASTSGYRNINNDEIKAEIDNRRDELRIRLQQQFISDAERARGIMFDIMNNDDSPPAVRFNAAKDFLDRAGFKPTDKVEHSGELSISNKAKEVEERLFGKDG